MRARGINYDTGTFPGNSLTRKTFDSQAVRREMAVIASDLHCDAVRISGREPERLTVAARHAADAGLEVWFSPFPVDLDPVRALALFAECAERAEAVRQAGADVVFVTGCEVSAFCHGFLPGDTYLDRLAAMVTADLDWWMSLGPVLDHVNAFLAEAAACAKSKASWQSAGRKRMATVATVQEAEPPGRHVHPSTNRRKMAGSTRLRRRLSRIFHRETTESGLGTR